MLSLFSSLPSPEPNRNHTNNQALVIVEIKYNPPDDFLGSGVGGRRSDGVCVGEGNYEVGERATTMKTEEQSSKSFDDDQQMLLDIQQNIQNLERTLNNQGRKRMVLFCSFTLLFFF